MKLWKEVNKINAGFVDLRGTHHPIVKKEVPHGLSKERAEVCRGT
jgi:hypothetical protein